MQTAISLQFVHKIFSVRLNTFEKQHKNMLDAFNNTFLLQINSFYKQSHNNYTKAI